MSEQLKLFDLQPGNQLPDETQEELPQSMRALLETGVSSEAVAALLERFPGCRLSIPMNPAPEHRLVRGVGLKHAKELAAAAGGERMEVPRCKKLRLQIRNRQIKKEFDANRPANDIVIAHEISYRQLWNILKNA